MSDRGDAALTDSRFLVDTSVWARLSTRPEAVREFTRLHDRVSSYGVLICPPVVAEFGFTARNASDHTRLMEDLSVFSECPEHPRGDETLALQNKLWSGGLRRAAGAMDTLIAAYAIKNRATLLHYDGDFEHIAAIEPALQHRWLLPRGSIA